jgi:hypothetical protein
VPTRRDNDDERADRIDRILRAIDRHAEDLRRRNLTGDRLRAGARPAKATLAARPARNKHA